MLIAACILLVLGLMITLANIAGPLSKPKGQGYSMIFFLSLLFSLTAYFLASKSLGFWAFLPTLLDPATWILAFAPFYLVFRAVFRKTDE